MQVLWVLENIKTDKEKHLFYTKLDSLLLLSSVFLYKKNHPNDTCILYCDKSTKDFLKTLNALDLWDEVKNLAINTFIDKSVFWASSKLEVLRNIKEPTIVMDNDFLIYKNISEMLNDKPVFTHKEDGTMYYPTANDPFIAEISDMISRPVPQAINCSFCYFPDYKFANSYAQFSLEMMERFTKLKAPNSTFLIFAEQLTLRHLLDYHRVEYTTLMKQEWVCETKVFRATEKGIIAPPNHELYFKHYWMDKPIIRKDKNTKEYKTLYNILKKQPELNLEPLKKLKN